MAFKNKGCKTKTFVLLRHYQKTKKKLMSICIFWHKRSDSGTKYYLHVNEFLNFFKCLVVGTATKQTNQMKH